MKYLLIFVILCCSVVCAEASMIWRAAALNKSDFDKIKGDSSLVVSRLEVSDTVHALDLEKDWHGIHFLLNGDPWKITSKAGLAILGGAEFGDDLGYGKAKYLSPDEVRSISKSLEKLPSDYMASKFSIDALEKADIYPNVWRRDGPDGLKGLESQFEQLKDFYSNAAKEGLGIVIAIL